MTGPAPLAHPPRRGAWAVLAVGVAAGLLILPVAHDLAHVVPIVGGPRWVSPAQRSADGHRVARDLLVWWALFAAAAATLARAPRRAAVAAALVLGVVIPVAALSHRATLSNDLYRYDWDGRVQAHGIDPYRYPPADPHLAGLRSEWLWPTPLDCARLGKPAGCWRINRVTERTIYPPVAEGWFTVAAGLIPIGAQDVGWEIAGLVLASAVSGVLLVTLRRSRGDPRRVAWWSLCPLVPVEAVQNAHVDTLAALTVALALMLARRGATLTAAGVGAAAVLTKLYPALLIPAVVRRRPWAGSLVAAATVALAYLPHVLAVGPRVLGYLPGYLHEEGYTGGRRFLLLNALGVPQRWAAVAALLAMVAVIAFSWRREADPAVAGGSVLLAAFLFATPVQPWYGLTLVAVAVLAARPEWLAVSAAGYPLYVALFAGSHAIGWGTGSYAAAAALVAAAALWRRAGVRLRAPVPAVTAA